ncbi:MAG: serine/threonine-protein kinase [Planctomycetota bacterium]
MKTAQRKTYKSTVNGVGQRFSVETACQVSNRWNRWSGVSLPDLLSEHPEIIADRSVFLDLAQEDFRLNRDKWMNRPAEDFGKRLAGLPEDLRDSLCRLIEVEQFLGNCAVEELLNQLEEVKWPTEGSSFGEFRIVCELGRGSMARVFLCRQAALGNREVVVKVSRAAIREAGALGLLDHINVVPIYAAGVDTETGLCWICMPYLGGHTLDLAIANAFLRKTAEVDLLGTRLPPARPSRRRKLYDRAALALFACVADGLEHVHQRGLLHGDLKPSNVLLTDSGVPMLIDFNLAQRVESSEAVLGGTLPYMSPEQLAAIASDSEDHELSTASDVYAFGVMLHQALTGRLPYEPLNTCGSLRDVARGFLGAQAAWRAGGQVAMRGLDQRVVRLIQHCLAELPAERPTSCKTLARSLREINQPRSCSLVFYNWLGGLFTET